MHAGGLVGDHTTASMVVELGAETTVWLTGSSTPCISLFKPWVFGNPCIPPVFASGHVEDAERYWRKRETFHRKAIGQTLPQAFYDEKSELETEWFAEAAEATKELMADVSDKAMHREDEFYEKWLHADLPASQGKRGYMLYWEKKTVALGTPERDVVEAR